MSLSYRTIAVGAVLALAACKGDTKPSDPLAQDPTLKQELELANSRDTTAKPQLKDVPATPPPAVVQPSAPRRVEHPRPRPVTPPSQVAQTPPPPPAQNTTPSGNTVQEHHAGNGSAEGRVGTVAAGTSLGVTSGQRVCTNTNTVGDRFTASLSDPIVASNGTTIPAGATAVLEVTSLKRSEKAGDNMAIGVVLRSIAYGGKTYPVNGEITSTQTEKVRAKDNNDGAKVAGGAVVGAVLGRIFSGKSKTKGTVIGAAGGAAAGAVLASQTGKYDACIPRGGKITIRLNSAMQIQSLSSDNGNSAPGI